MIRLQYAEKVRNRKISVVRCMVVGLLTGGLMMFPVRDGVRARQSTTDVGSGNASPQQVHERNHPAPSTKTIDTAAGLRKFSQAKVALKSNPQNNASIWA